MTTFQDPPLQSRRAARENVSNPSAPSAADEADSALAASTAPSSPPVPEPSNAERLKAEPLNAEPLNAVPLNYATTSRPPLPQYDGQSLRPRRTADTDGRADLSPTEALAAQDSPSYRPKDFSPEGRRAASANWAPQHDPSVGDPTPVAVPAPATAAAAVVAEGTMTRRELRALREANGIAATPPDQTESASPTGVEAGQVDTSTVAAPPASVETPALVEPPAVAAPPALIEPPARVELPAFVAPTPQPSSRLDSALAEFDALAAGREPAVQTADAPAPLPGRRAAQPLSPDAPAAAAFPLELAPAPQASTQIAPEAAPVVPAPLDVAPFPVAPAFEQAAPQPVVSEPTAPAHIEPEPVATVDGLSAFDALFAASSDELPELVVEPELDSFDARTTAPSAAAQLLAPPAADPLVSAPAPQGVPASVLPPVPHIAPAPVGDSASGALIAQAPAPFPAPADLPAPPASVLPTTGPGSVGHWSTQSDIDDAEQINETTISRSVGVGNGAITTSALVLPSVPEHSLGGAMNASGEIMLTGSISLPQSLSMTGAHASQLDESDLDHLLDPGDQQVATTDSTPVRAASAVSTHTGTSGIIAPQKPKGTRGFTILIVAASVMAIVVVGLLVAGLVSGTL